MAFFKALSGFSYHQRKVEVFGLIPIQSPIECELSKCGGHEISTSQDLCDAEVMIVHDAGEVVASDSITSPNHKVIDRTAL
jgi:hypothetical protein